MLAYAAGDAGAFARLFERHERPVFRFLLRSVGAAAAADDLLQETWLAVVRNAAAYEPRARFTTWLYGIARTKLIDHWRRNAVLGTTVAFDDPVANDPEMDTPAALAPVDSIAGDVALQPEVQAMSRAQALALMRAVETLPAVQREAFLLHLEGGLTHEEIAELTGVGTETVKSRLRYALNKLRVSLEDWR